MIFTQNQFFGPDLAYVVVWALWKYYVPRPTSYIGTDTGSDTYTKYIYIFWWNRTYVIKSTFLGLCSLYMTKNLHLVQLRHTWWFECFETSCLIMFFVLWKYIYSFTYPTCLSYILMKLKIIYSKYTLNIQYLCLSIYPKTGFGPNFAHMMV